MKNNLVFHPLLFTMYVVLAPVANNITLAGGAAVKSLLTGMLAAAVVIAVVRWRVKDKIRAGLVTSGLLVALFSYGHVTSLLSRALRTSSLALDALVVAAFLALLAAWIAFVVKRLPNPYSVNNYLNLMSLILVAFPLYTIIRFTGQAGELQAWGEQYRQVAWEENGVMDVAAGAQPKIQPGTDIYYLILDGYTRSDVLRELYGYDNSEFLRALEQRGFYIADQSRANYMETVFSVSSSLNMAHIASARDFAVQNTPIKEREPFRDMVGFTIGRNRVIEFLRDQGYQIVQFESAYDRLRFDEPDQLMKLPSADSVNAGATFEMMLMNTTVGNLYFKLRGKDYVPLQSLYDRHRENILYTFDTLPQIARQDGAYFVYAHVVNPHPPYVFGPNGEARRSAEPFTLLDSNPSDEWTPDLYRDQVAYISKLTLKMVDEILAAEGPKPVIIIQADHSSRTYAASERTMDINMDLLFPILNAYYLPDVAADEVVYPQITPVNTFRSIFNYYFDTRLPLLEETSYAVEYRGGLIEFVNACETYNACR